MENNLNFEKKEKIVEPETDSYISNQSNAEESANNDDAIQMEKNKFETSNEDNLEEELTLEDIEESLEKAINEFTVLTEWNLVENEIISQGRKIIELINNNTESDINLVKKYKAKYLKGLLLCIDEIKAQESGNLSEIEENNAKKNPLRSGFRVNIEKVNDKTIVGEVKSWTNKDVILGLENGETISVPLGKFYSFSVADQEVEVKNDEDKNSYEKARTQLLEVKKEYQTKKAEYDHALDDFYQNKSFLTKTAEFLGFKPNLPSDLQEIEIEYKNLKSKYVTSLNSALEKRSILTYEGVAGNLVSNNEYDSSAKNTKVAFAEKFIIKPNEQLLRRQEEFALSEAQKSQMRRIFGVLGKHKWFIRFGAITMAGLAGAATGGLTALATGSGMMAGRIAAGAVAGSFAGSVSRKLTQGFVEQATKNVENTKENILKSFSIDDLNKLEDQLFEAQNVKDNRIKAQKVANIASAVLAGVAVSGSVDVLDNNREIISNLSEDLGKNKDVTVSDLGIDAKAVEAPNVTEVDLHNLTISNEITLRNEYLDSGSGKSFDIKITEINLTGEHSELAKIPNDKIVVIEKAIKLAVSDLLADKPNLPKTELENGVFTKLEKEFKNSDWWKESDIKSVSFGAVEKIEVPKNIPEVTEVKKVDVLNSEEAVKDVNSETYVVKKNDNIWNITEQLFAKDLSVLSEIEKNQVISELVTKFEKDKSLLESLNIKSNDIDLIYPNETLKLDKFHSELVKIIEAKSTDSFEIKTANLKINIEGDGVEKIPISVNTGSAEEVDSANFSKEASPIPAPLSNTVNEIEYPSIVNTVNVIADNNNDQLNSSETPTSEIKNYSKILNNTIIGIERSAYDFFSPREGFESPYNLMKGMTMKDIIELREMDKTELKQVLKDNGIKYEAYCLWQDEIDKIKNDFQIYNENLTLKEQLKAYILKRKINIF